MTEVERIINKGVISRDFLKEEVRNDFLVTKERKKVWTVLLDLMLEFDEVCKKNGLTYFLEAGSLLGAVRHRGFIPWDDDVDVLMPRKDYQRFVELSHEFTAPYFLQTPYTDNGYFYSFAKIRNSNTTGLTQMFAYQGFNNGMWLSVFPLDNWDEVGGEERYATIKSLNMDNSTYMRISNPFLSEKDRERVKNYSGRNPFDTIKELDRIAQECNDHSTKYMTVGSSAVISYSRKLWYADDFSSALDWDFEDFKFPIPVGYERFLRIMYGDYMKLPPVEQRGLHHGNTIFNADIPYKEYMESYKKNANEPIIK